MKLKHWLPLLLCCILLLGGCGGKDVKSASGGESVPAGYLPGGVKTILTQLAQTNDYLVRAVLVQHRLATDPEQTVTQDGVTYALVTDARIGSYAALADLLNATYTSTAAENLLAEGMYAEIDGKLYCNTALAPKTAGGEPAALTVETGTMEKDEIRFEAVYADGTKVAMTAKNSGGAWRLADLYQF